MALTNQTNIKELSDDGAGGTRMGQSATDLISFHGATPSDQRATTADIATTATVTTTPHGFTTGTQADNLVLAVNEIFAILQEKGLMAS